MEKTFFVVSADEGITDHYNVCLCNAMPAVKGR
jgi:hypothetical protein